MKIGKTIVPTSAICASDDETIVVRGADLCRDLIGKLGFLSRQPRRCARAAGDRAAAAGRAQRGLA